MLTKIKLDAYIDYIATLNLPKNIPELNASALDSYNKLLGNMCILLPNGKVWAGESRLRNQDIYLDKETSMAFAVDNYEDGSLRIPLSSAMSHPYVPYLYSDLPKALASFQDSWRSKGGRREISPETVSFGPDNPDSKLDSFPTLFFNSPIVELKNTWDEYLLSLTAKRRYKVKEAQRWVNECEVSKVCYTNYETRSWMKLHLIRRWCVKPSDRLTAEFALNQLYWSFACETISATRYLVAKDSINNILGIAHFIKRDRHFVFQGIVLNSFMRTSNLGAFLLSSFIKHCHDYLNPDVDYVDPTCRVNFNESSVDTYKRLVVNKDNLKPVFYASGSVGKDSYIKPPYYTSSKGWETTKEQVILFDGV